MATIAPRSTAIATLSHAVERKPMTVAQAMRLAWLSWAVMLTIPFFVFLAAVWRMGDDVASDLVRQQWFLTGMGYVALSVPAAFFLRSRYFARYYKGERVAPSDYLKGNLILWGAMEIGGLISLAGCLMTHSLAPNIVPAMVAFVLFVPFWPKGQAMTDAGVGNSDDHALYEEPR